MLLHFEKLHPLVQGLPKIVMLSSSDLPGAGGATLDLQAGLSAAGANVTTLVMSKTTQRGGVIEIDQAEKLKKVYSIMSGTRLKAYTERAPYFEIFSINKSPVDLLRISEFRKAGIVHLHWVAGMVGFPEAGEALRDKHVVWTLHDMNPLAGGCHYTAGCPKYALGGCSACPQLGKSADKRDIALQNFSAKQSGYAAMDMTIVSPAVWQNDCVQKSLLLRHFPRTTIANAVDTHVFRPMPRLWARATLGLPFDRKILVFGAAGIGRWNKGLSILRIALEKLRNMWRGPLPLLLIFGGNADEAVLPQGYESVVLARLAPSELAKVYSSADVFVSTSLQEAFGLVTAEAQACGTPGIGFVGTGAEDIIVNGVTGYLSTHPGLPLDDNGTLRSPEEFLNSAAVDALASKIIQLLELPPEKSIAMRRHCREHASNVFSPVLQTGRYLSLYRRILGLPEILVEGLNL